MKIIVTKRVGDLVLKRDFTLVDIFLNEDIKITCYHCGEVNNIGKYNDNGDLVCEKYGVRICKNFGKSVDLS